MTTQLKKGKDFIKAAEKSDKVKSFRQNGSHVIITVNNGESVVVPDHNCHDLGTGLRVKLLKRFIQLGIIVGCLVFAMIQLNLL